MINYFISLSGYPVANPKSGPDYSVFITKYIFFFNFTYTVTYPMLTTTELTYSASIQTFC
jgi:hypothetical protein